jgi:tetratricopeptide (TPR) repeat protein
MARSDAPDGSPSRTRLELKRKGDYDRAIVDYTEAISLGPKYANAYYNRGLAWEEKND